MTDTRALLKFNECINAFFNSRLIIVDRTIAEFLSTVVSTPELMQVVTECARTFNFKRELSNAVESDNLGTRFMLPHNKRHVVALVTGLLNEFDRKNMSIVDFVTGFYPADASHTSYMSFCENVLRPYAEAFRSLLIGEDPDENKAAVADERSASPINDKAKEDADYWLRVLIDNVIALNDVPDDYRREAVTMLKGMLYALELSNPLLIKLIWIGLKNTLGIYKLGMRELKEIETILLNYGVID